MIASIILLNFDFGVTAEIVCSFVLTFNLQYLSLNASENDQIGINF